MYQIEVKRNLIEKLLNPSDGWAVTVDLDAMEMGKGPDNTQHKRDSAALHRQWMEDNGIRIQAHKKFGRADVVATHPDHGTVLVECEGDACKQKEQAMYSALGQLLLYMDGDVRRYGLAVPNSSEWEIQVNKIPDHVKKILNLTVYLVSDSGVREK
jgi:hypothetical protein